MMSRLCPRRATLLVAVYATVQFLYTYWTHPHHPTLVSGAGAEWYLWSDQSHYLLIANKLAQGRIQQPFIYGPGYPIVAVPFLHLLPRDPFLVPNVLLYVGTLTVCFYLVCAFLSVELSLVTIVVLSQGDQFLNFFVEPWSNIVTIFCMALLLMFVVHPPRRQRLAAGIVGVCLGWTFAARYGDALLLFPVACAALLSLAPTWKDRLRLGVTTTLTTVPILIWVFWIHYVLFGSPFITPYSTSLDPITGGNSQDISNHLIQYVGYHLFSILINPLIFNPSIKGLPLFHSIADRPLLSYYFVIILSATGLAFLGRQHRNLVYSFGLSLGLALIYYGSYWSTGASDLKFRVLRFFAPWEPMLICAAVAGIIGLLRADWRAPANRRLIGISLLIPILFGVGLYGLGRWQPPFPDTMRLIPKQRWIPSNSWRVSTTAATDKASLAIDDTVTTGWWAKGMQPVGTNYMLDLGTSYRLDHLFLTRRENSKSGPVTVTVELSTDNRQWETPTNLQVESPEERIMAFHFDTSVARYARFSLTAESTQAGWAIDEIYAYGEPVPRP